MKKVLLMVVCAFVFAGGVAAKETTKVERVMKKACDIKVRKVDELNRKLNTLRTKLDRAVAKKADTTLVDTAKTAVSEAQSAVDTQSKATCEDLKVLEASLKDTRKKVSEAGLAVAKAMASSRGYGEKK